MTHSDQQNLPDQAAPARSSNGLVLALAWLAVVIPLAWGVEQTIKKALALFG
jgi:hypothetical protein